MNFVSGLRDCFAFTVRAAQTRAHIAIRDNQLEELKDILAAGLDVDRPFAHPFKGERITLMFTAANFGNQEAVDVLLSYGATAGYKDSEGHTAADRAYLGGFPDLGERLEEAADMDVSPKIR